MTGHSIVICELTAQRFRTVRNRVFRERDWRREDGHERSGGEAASIRLEVTRPLRVTAT